MAENFQDNVAYNGSTLFVSGDALKLGSTDNGAKSIVFNNSGSEGHLAWQPSANRTINLPDAGGTLLLSSQGILSLSAGGAQVTSGQVIFSNSNGVSFGVNGQTVTAAHNALTTARASNDGVGLNTAKTNVTWTVNSSGLSLDAGGYAGTGFTSTTTAGTAVKATQNTAGLSMAVPAFLTAAAGGGFSAGVSTGGNTAGNTGVTGTQIVFVGSNNITLSQNTDANGATITVSGATAAAAPVNFSAGTTSNNLGSVVFSNSNLVSFGLNGSTVTGSVPGTSSLSATGAFSISVNGATISMGVVAQTNQTVGLYALGNTTQDSSSTVLDARSLSFNAVGNFGSVGFSNGSIVLSGHPHISSYENFGPFQNLSTLTLGVASQSLAVYFQMPQEISASFMRFPALMTVSSASATTLNSATATAQAGIFWTFNAVVYSLGTGANSRSLISVASGSVGQSFTNQISMSNSSQGSYSQGYTYGVEGNAANTTSQYSLTSASYEFRTTGFQSLFSSSRWFDVPFASSLTPGPYWLLVGNTSSSSSAGPAGFAVMTNVQVRLSGIHAVSQINNGIGVMGSTNSNSGGMLGAATFSTAGGGTTSGFPISALTSMASNPRLYFQMLRSA